MYVYSNLDLIPYISVYFILLLLSLVRSSRETMIIGTTILVLFAGIRYGIGYDYIQYLKIITSNEECNYEWASCFFIRVARYYNIPQIFFFINSFIFVVPIAFVCFRLKKNSTICLLCLFLIPYLFIDAMSIIRNASAYSLVFLGSYFFINKSYIKCFLFCFIALGFHSSASISFLVMFSIYLSRRSTIVVNYVIISIGLLFMFYNISGMLYNIAKVYLPYNLVDSASYYFVNNAEQGRFVKFILFFIGFLNLFLYQKLINIDSRNKIYIYMFNVGLLVWGIFSFDHTLSLRLSTYFMIFLVLICNSYCNIYFFKKFVSGKSILILFLSLYLTSSFIVNIAAYTQGKVDKISFLPYQTIFNYREYFNF